MTSLRDLQIACIKRMFTLDPAITQHITAGVWKVLVFDALGRDVISSVLRVSDLREAGVTVHMQLAADRQPISDVPAVYFVEPTQANIDRVVADLNKGLYEAAYLNFSSSITRALLEDLASKTAQAGTAGQIAGVVDQHLNFIVSEPDLFSLGMRDVFVKLNAPGIAEDEIDGTIERIVSGLFSVILTLDNIPIIRCPAGNAAESVARKLDARIRDHLLNARQSGTGAATGGSGTGTYQRPVLVLLDRTVDLVSMLSHSWTYQALVHDLCDLQLNRITLPADVNATGTQAARKAYDLDPSDFFWQSNANTVFPAVAEHLQTELDKYTREKAELTRTTGVTEIEELDPAHAGTTVHLQAALKALPAMQARKQTLDMHMTIATALLKGVQERQIDKFVESEETIARIQKTALLAALKDDARKPDDRLRLLMIYYLSVEEVKKADLAEYEAALTQAGCDLKPLQALKKVRDLTRMTLPAVAAAPVQQSGTTDQLFRGFSSLSSKFGERLQQAGLSDNLNNLISGVKNFLPSSSNLTVTRIVESLMEPSSGQSYTGQAKSLTENYLYFDPRQRSSQVVKPSKPQTFGEAVVFCVGGGNYVEYGNLLDWSARQEQAGRSKRVIYGSTEIMKPGEFVEDLAKLL